MRASSVSKQVLHGWATSILLALGFAGCTETSESGTSALANERLSLQVQVLDTNELPVVAARVNLNGLPMQTSDEAGIVTFEDLAPGRYFVHIERTGYVPTNIDVDLRDGNPGKIQPRLMPIVSGGICADESSDECSVMTPDQTTCTGGSGCGGIGIWSKTFHAQWISAASVVADDAGNVILAGDKNNEQMYVVKYDGDGNELWTKFVGQAPGGQNVQRLLVDAGGNVVFISNFYGTLDVDGNSVTSDGDCDILVAKFDANGNHLWSRRYGGENHDSVDTAALDSAGNLVLAGMSSDWVDFDNGSFFGNFVMKVDSNGDPLWTMPFHVNVATYGVVGMLPHNFHVRVDIRRNIILSGVFGGTANFGVGTVQSNGETNAFLVKLDPYGQHVWSKQFGNTDSVEMQVKDVVTDSAGNVVLIGTVGGKIDFGGGILTNVGNPGIFLASFNEAGQHRWSNRFEGEHGPAPIGTTVGASGDVVITGQFPYTANFGGGTFTNRGGGDVYVAKFDSLGHHLWSRQFGVDFSEYSSVTAMDGAGNVFIAGNHFGEVDFGTGLLVPGDFANIFLAKLTP